MMGFGFVVARFGLFLRELAAARGESFSEGSGSLLAGTALVILGVVVNLHAAVAHVRFRRRYGQGDPTPSHSSFGIVIAGLLAVVGVSMAVYLVLRA